MPLSASGPLELMSDLSPASWLVERLWNPWSGKEGNRVGSIVPSGFDAYVRVFHPPNRRAARAPDRPSARWAEVAIETGHIAHPEMQWDRIAVGAGSAEPRFVRPETEMPRPVCEALVEVLRAHTTMPELCWFLMWEGYGWLGGPSDVPHLSVPSAENPFRTYLLYRGALDVRNFEFVAHESVGFAHLRRLGASQAENQALVAQPMPVFQAPDIWWPEDRAWVLGSDTDLDTTYVACSAECAEALLKLKLRQLECLSTRPEHRVDIDGDSLNA